MASIIWLGTGHFGTYALLLAEKRRTESGHFIRCSLQWLRHIVYELSVFCHAVLETPAWVSALILFSSGFYYTTQSIILAFVFFASQPHKLGTHCLLAFKNLSHFLLSDFTSPQDVLFPDSAATRPPMRHDSRCYVILLACVINRRCFFPVLSTNLSRSGSQRRTPDRCRLTLA